MLAEFFSEVSQAVALSLHEIDESTLPQFAKSLVQHRWWTRGASASRDSVVVSG